MRTVVLLSQAERDEDAAQQDMRIRGERLARFRAETEGKAWREQPNGEWHLEPVLTDG